MADPLTVEIQVQLFDPSRRRYLDKHPEPGLLLSLGDGSAVSFTENDLYQAMCETSHCNPHTEWPRRIIAKLIETHEKKEAGRG